MTTPFEIFRSSITLRRPINGSEVNGLWVDSSNVTLSQDLVTGNIINMTLNGIALAPVAFSGTSLATLQALAAEIQAQSGIQVVLLTGTGSRTIQIVPVIPNLSIVNSFVVTGGASQPSITIVNSPVLSAITASIQPLNGEEMEMLPEARREKEIYKMFTSSVVQTLQNTQNPDQVQFFGKVFEVYEVKPWQNTNPLWPTHNYCYYVMRLQPLTPPPS